ncbi:hypothetical protein ASD36_00025 [Rhizobium sp. Root1334]|uniref:hypothetical protein n=1 Tax=unclassified Rhizobium TaxID=2613769 RepID=UPI000726B1D4|nr:MULTISPECIES: hypothetical protein [unclassified Rhizobium]KQY17096.1 hypothetical protein ASD36_00025 [Rhizobium sp. Root1334]
MTDTNKTMKEHADTIREWPTTDIYNLGEFERAVKFAHVVLDNLKPLPHTAYVWSALYGKPVQHAYWTEVFDTAIEEARTARGLELMRL